MPTETKAIRNSKTIMSRNDEHPVAALPAHLNSLFGATISDGVTEATEIHYRQRAEDVAQHGKDYDFEGFCEFVYVTERDRPKEGKERYSAGILCQYKSACIYVCAVETRKWTDAESLAID